MTYLEFTHFKWMIDVNRCYIASSYKHVDIRC